MKKILLVAITMYGFAQSNLRAMQTHPADELHEKRMTMYAANNESVKKFIEKFSQSSDDDLKELRENEIDIYDGRDTVNFCNKRDDIFRIVNAEKMRSYIKSKNYQYVDVPKKFLFLAGNRWKVIAEKIENREPEKKISLTAVQELVDIVVTTGFSDFDGENIFLTKEGKFFFIDTENNSFGCSAATSKEKVLKFLEKNKKHLAEDAANWIKAEADNKTWERIEPTIASMKIDGDPVEIDYEAIYKLFIKEEFQKQQGNPDYFDGSQKKLEFDAKKKSFKDKEAQPNSAEKGKNHQGSLMVALFNNVYQFVANHKYKLVIPVIAFACWSYFKRK